MTAPPFTSRRFDWALRTRGPALDSWPAPERDAALLLLRHDPAARRALADALTAEDAPEPDPATLRRMQHVVRRALAPPPPVVRGMGWSALAACVAAGLYVGVAASDPEPDAIGSSMQASLSATVLAALDP